MSLARTGEKNSMYGKHLSEEAKRKIGSAHRGKHLSEEIKRKVSESLKGRHLSEETKRKISDAMFGKRGKDTSMFGRQHSEETKRKMSESQKGKHPSEETNARRVLSRRMGKENYAKIKSDQVWDGTLLNIRKIVGEYRGG